MDEHAERRIAVNEARFRAVNEAIERGVWQGEEDSASAFRCECANPGCNRLVALEPREYERIRKNPRWFLLLRGHELPEVETIVEMHPEHVVVEKRGAAGRQAEATDPRS